MCAHVFFSEQEKNYSKKKYTQAQLHAHAMGALRVFPHTVLSLLFYFFFSLKKRRE